MTDPKQQATGENKRAMDALKDLDKLVKVQSRHVQTQLLHEWLDLYLEDIRTALINGGKSPHLSCHDVVCNASRDKPVGCDMCSCIARRDPAPVVGEDVRDAVEFLNDEEILREMAIAATSNHDLQEVILKRLKTLIRAATATKDCGKGGA